MSSPGETVESKLIGRVTEGNKVEEETQKKKEAENAQGGSNWKRRV